MDMLRFLIVELFYLGIFVIFLGHGLLESPNALAKPFANFRQFSWPEDDQYDYQNEKQVHRLE